MGNREARSKVLFIVLLISGILCLHYFTFPERRYHHAFYRMLFYLPLVLGSFWFGLKGAIGTSLAVSAFYLPYVITKWQGLSLEAFDQILEGVLYVVIAFVLGLLVERARERQRQLVEMESLAAMGRALSEVAHDMKTPLIAIGGLTTQVHRRLQEEDAGRKKLEVVIQETARLESMVKEMLDFGGPMRLYPDEQGLNELVVQSLEVVQAMAESPNVTLKKDLDTALPPLALDSARVKQLLLNLLSNAVQASPAGEEIWVRTHANRDHVELEVADHGCGIREENVESIFHPFVSTKKGGAGLGLAIVKKIAEAHGGNVSVRPNSGKGVTFAVHFAIQNEKLFQEIKERP